MRKTKAQKGITLIALIITIVVLLILAVVTIREIQGEGIIGYAKRAKSEYENGVETEKNIIGGYLSLIESSLVGGNNTIGENNIESSGEGETTITWTDNGDGTFTSSYGVTVEIGDYVDYNEGTGYTHTPDTSKGAGTSQTGGSKTTGYTLGTTQLTTENLSWRVLGVNQQGQLELISADPTTQTLYLANDEGYVNAEDNLNNFCNDLYGKGIYASSARSLRVEDINKLANYNPTTYGGYGTEWIYRYPTEEEIGSTTRYMQYSKDNGTTWKNTTNSDYQTFRLPEETTAINSTNPGIKEMTTTYYYYSIADNLTTEDGFTSEKVTEISNMISQGTSGSNVIQWLASRSEYCDLGYTQFYVRCVYSGNVSDNNLFVSNESFFCSNNRIRPIVSLTTEITLTGTGEDVGSKSNMWSIVQN